jgi:uncharacterized membrane protein
MELYFVLKLIHILSAAILFGTGIGIAFFMLLADRTGDVKTIAATARIVVIADFLFTATAVVVQPVRGIIVSHGKISMGGLGAPIFCPLSRYRLVLVAGCLAAE